MRISWLFRNKSDIIFVNQESFKTEFKPGFSVHTSYVCTNNLFDHNFYNQVLNEEKQCT